MENKPTNKLDPADSSNSIRLVLSSGNGLTSFNLPKSSLMPTTTSESNEAKVAFN
ncbi:unnamed protein product [Trichobilharzia regenti]|nr:unnamed protein product [Trichobilharzia regenti]